MCHRYNLTPSPDAVVRFLESFRIDVSADVLPSKDYYPVYDVLTVRMIDDDKWALEPRSWGFLPKSWKPTSKVTTRKSFQRGKINARSETVHTTWPWKFAFPSQRCVMLASSLFEPFKDGGDAHYRLPEHDVFCFAGLWDHFEGDDGKGHHETVDSCVMLTTDANALVASTRKGRMRQPAILTSAADIKRYCSLEVTEHGQLNDLLTPWPAESMTVQTPPSQPALFQ